MNSRQTFRPNPTIRSRRIEIYGLRGRKFATRDGWYSLVGHFSVFYTRLSRSPLRLCPLFFYVYFVSQLRLHSRGEGGGEKEVYSPPLAFLRSVSSRTKVIIAIGISRYSWKLIFKSTWAVPANSGYLPFISPNLMRTRHRYFIIYLCVCICMRARVQLCARCAARVRKPAHRTDEWEFMSGTRNIRAKVS